MSARILSALALLSASAWAQSAGEADLEGEYFYHALAVESRNGFVAQTSNRSGRLEFGDDGLFATGSARHAYWEQPSGVAVLDGFLEGFGSFDARIGADAETLFGIAHGFSSGDVAVVAAVRTLGEAFEPTSFQGAYQAALATFPPSGPATPVVAFARFDAEQAVLSVAADGSGTLSVPSGLGLATTEFDIAVAADAGLIIGSPAGVPGLLIAVRREAATPDAGLWVLELAFGRSGPAAAVGGLAFSDAARARIHERWLGPGGATDFRGESAFRLMPDGTGALDATPVVAAAGGGLLGGVSAAGGIALLLAIPAPAAPDGEVFADPRGNVSAASLSPAGAPAAPGELRSLFGRGLASQVAAAESLPLPVELAGASILVDDAAAPLLFVSAGQVNYQLPEDAPGPIVRIVARNGAESSDEIFTRVAATSPAVFTLDGSGGGAGVFTHADFTLVSPAAPARGGEIVVAFLTGLGVNQPLPEVRIGGRAAEVLFAGRAPGFVGLDQLNLRIPVNAPIGDAVPFTVATRDAWSDTVTITIGQ